MVRTSKELGRGRREKWRRRACAPRPSVFLPCLISFLPLLVSRIGAIFSVCSSVAQRVIFVGAFLSWLWSFRQEGPRLQMWAGQGVGNRAAHCTGRTGGARGAIRSSILPSQNQAVCCHTHTHTPLLPEPLLCLFAAKICKRLQSYADRQISILQVLESFLIKETPLKVRESMEPSFLQFVLYLFLLYYIMYS